MYGEIATKRELTELLESNSHIVEVYGDNDFKLSNSTENLYILLDIPKDKAFCSLIDVSKLLSKYQACFDYKSMLYFAQSSFDVLLENKKLIWRKGKWFI